MAEVKDLVGRVASEIVKELRKDLHIGEAPAIGKPADHRELTFRPMYSNEVCFEVDIKDVNGQINVYLGRLNTDKVKPERAQLMERKYGELRTYLKQNFVYIGESKDMEVWQRRLPAMPCMNVVPGLKDE